MKTRRSYADVVYNGANVTAKLGAYLTGFSYSDPAEGEADSITLSIHDQGRQWVGAWLPKVGDTMSATIKLEDWTGEGDSRALPCGSFVLDDFDFSGWPLTGSISAVSVPAKSDFRETARTKTWENVTLAQIGQEIAERAGIALTYDAEEITIRTMEQTDKTDCEFYTELCADYGLMVKVYAEKIVVYDRESYKKKASAGTLTPADLEAWSWKERLSGTYTGGLFTYTDPDTSEEIRVEVGEPPRVLSLNGKADSKADAERMLKAAIANANHGARQMSVTIMGNASFVATQCVEVKGMGALSGKYYIDSVSHSLGGSEGYKMSLELSFVE